MVQDSSRPEFLGWLREATVWQRIGRLVPLSWILILVWPLTLLLTRGLPPADLAVSVFGLAIFVLVWTWFWLQPRTGTDPAVTTGVLAGLTATAGDHAPGRLGPFRQRDRGQAAGFSLHSSDAPPAPLCPARAPQPGRGGRDLDDRKAGAVGGLRTGLRRVVENDYMRKRELRRLPASTLMCRWSLGSARGNGRSSA